jgi:uncharacterized protein YbgA (DUF1722 family)
MDAYATARIEALAHEGLHGYVLKKDSPSCGLFRVKVYDRNNSPSRTGRGVFAAHLAERFPLLPIEEEGRLNDPVLRENFVVRAFTLARWTRYRAHDASPAGLVRFHTIHKTLVLTHDPNAYGEMGRLVARAGDGDAGTLHDAYGALMMQALARHASRGRHVNALQHLSGFVKDDLGADEKRELGRLLAEYRGGFVPLVVPVTLVRHLIRRHAPGSWADQQIYLEPYAARLMLRNAV